MNKNLSGFVVFLLLFAFLTVPFSAEIVDSLVIYDSDFSLFSDLRQAVAENNEEKVLQLRDEFGKGEAAKPHNLFPSTVSDAESLLLYLDKNAFALVSNEENSVLKFTMTIERYTYIYAHSQVAGISIQSRNRSRSEHVPHYPSEPTVASLRLEDGTEIGLRKNPTTQTPIYYGDYYYSRNGEDYVISLLIAHVDQSDCSPINFDLIGPLSFVSFAEETRTTSAFMSNLWHIALPVGGGIAVVGSLAAVLLLRKKKTFSVEKEVVD